MRAGFLFPKCSQSGSLLEDQDEQERKRFIDSKIAQHRLEKFFPVYALGISMPDSDSFVSVFNSDDPLADPIWDAVKEEAKLEAEKEPILSSFLYASILSHDCLEQALGFVLANRLQNPTLLAAQLMDIFCEVIMHDTSIQRSIHLDMQAFKDRDPACLSYCSVLLYLKILHLFFSFTQNQIKPMVSLLKMGKVSSPFPPPFFALPLSLFLPVTVTLPILPLFFSSRRSKVIYWVAVISSL
ncbi:hypothetical protein I3760_07G004000 [Carya illinoinensis]|nr:hypothetical protein I3760_07G004000 [Carya illinoinensis]